MSAWQDISSRPADIDAEQLERRPVTSARCLAPRCKRAPFLGYLAEHQATVHWKLLHAGEPHIEVTR